MTQGSPVSSNARLHVMACLVVGSLISGCDGAKLCQPCERQPETVESVKVEADWQKLAEALKELRADGERQPGTVKAEVDWQKLAEVLNELRADGERQPGTVKVEVDWQKLAEALKEHRTDGESGTTARTDCADCGTAKATTEIHHATFAFRFAPPWFNSDQRSLFTSYVVFPEEAKLDEWLDDEVHEGCPRKDGRVPSSLCPDRAFYGRTMGSFLNGLLQCATEDKKVELYTVGFASSTGLNNIEENGTEATVLKERYEHLRAAQKEGCVGKKAQAHDSSDRFNLLIANERAVNAAAMLRELVPKRAEGEKERFDIKPRFWCSYASMDEERSWNGRGDTTIGLMNRRAEVHVASCPAAWTSIRTVGRTD